VLSQGEFVDEDYTARRKASFIVAAGCTAVAPTCFCASMGTGPRPQSAFDLCLTECLDADGHRFVVETGSARGASALAAIPHAPAAPELAELPRAVADRAEARMTRRVDPGAGAAVAANRENALWDDVASRCLTCANCTAVCPTCFCHTVEDTTDLEGCRAERRRKWDSCFTMGFTFVNAGSVRYSAASRYRQWLTHKFHAWEEQFGAGGCVGCGRCITWCPVGIDVTEELARLGGASQPPKEGDGGYTQSVADGQSVLP
jgi:formate hydrogenlyase subunit 6/NADH:ubiquinone oxidoreductase subunit I